MLVILRDNVPNLGTVGDVVKVSDGYARNFLLPRKMVVVANEENVRELEHHKRVLEKKRKAQKAEFESLAAKLGEFSATVARKVGRNDKLFGSVTTTDIASSLKKGGFDIDKSMIQLKDPIKALGIHPVAIRLPHGVTASVKVWVVKEGSAPEEESSEKKK